MKIEAKSIIAALFLALSAADSQARPSDQDLIAEAKEIIQDDLRDPDATLFRAVRLVQNPGEKIISVCGEFNASNGYGGKVGYKSFIVQFTLDGKTAPGFTMYLDATGLDGRRADTVEGGIFTSFCVPTKPD